MSCCTVKTMNGSKPLHQAAMENFSAAFSVAMVSMPLSLTLGVACGATPEQGLAAAVLGGAISGLVGSSDHNIVGCANNLAPVLMLYSYTWGAEVLPYITLGAAVAIFVCWLMSLHRYMLFLPHCVFEGFSVSICIALMCSQMHSAMKTVPEATHKHHFMNIVEGIKVVPNADLLTTSLFAGLFLALVVLTRYRPRVPWMVVITMVSIPFGWGSHHGASWAPKVHTLHDKFGELSPWNLFHIPMYLDHVAKSPEDYQGILTGSIAVAFVAILETLISAKIGTIRTGWKFDESREVLGLCASTLGCGLFGTVPPSGLFLRTSINIQNKATHKIAHFMNAVILFLVCLLLLPVLSYLPMVTVAAILFADGARMIPWSYLKQLARADRAGLMLLATTTASCVIIDPASGLVIGAVMALLVNARQSNEGRRLVEREQRPNGAIFRPVGPVTYVVAEKIVEDFSSSASAFTRTESCADAVDRDDEVVTGATGKVLSLQCVTALDHDGAQALGKVYSEWQLLDIGVAIACYSQKQHGVLENVDWFLRARKAGCVLKSEDEALVKVEMHTQKGEEEPRPDATDKAAQDSTNVDKQPLLEGA